MDGTVSAAADSSKQFTTPLWQRKFAHSNPGVGAGLPTHPHPERRGPARADRVHHSTGCGKRGKVLSAIRNFRRGSGGLRETCGRATPGGLAEPHEVGTNSDVSYAP